MMTLAHEVARILIFAFRPGADPCVVLDKQQKNLVHFLLGKPKILRSPRPTRYVHLSLFTLDCQEGITLHGLGTGRPHLPYRIVMLTPSLRLMRLKTG